MLLNGPQFVEASRALAERLQREHASDPAALVTSAFRTLTSRPPDPAEQKILVRLYTEQLDHYRARPGDAECFLAIGNAPTDSALPAPELAAATTVINTLMNHDAFVVKR